MSAMEMNTNSSPLDLYRTVWAKVGRNFFDPQRLGDWRRWEHRFDGMLASEQEAVSAVREMLGSLGDAYTYLIAPSNGDGPAPAACSSQMLANGIAYVEITTFNCSDLCQQLQAALRAVRGARGFVVDLRRNGGGFVNAASNATSMFLTGGPNVSIRSRTDAGYRTRSTTLGHDRFHVEEVDDDGNVTETNSWDRFENIVGDRPLVLLVSRQTASAAEMFASILRDCRRAMLIGEQTFGKGIGQDQFSMPLGYSLKVTDMQWVSPSGKWVGDCGQTYRDGLMPDWMVPSNGNPRRDNQLRAAMNYMADLLGVPTTVERPRSGGLLLAAGALALVYVATRRAA